MKGKSMPTDKMATWLARLGEIRDLGFKPIDAVKWANLENALGRQVCYHVYVGVPEIGDSGKCSSCWQPPAPSTRFVTRKYPQDYCLATRPGIASCVLRPGHAERGVPHMDANGYSYTDPVRPSWIYS
jgi:hypothetical protein